MQHTIKKLQQQEKRLRTEQKHYTYQDSDHSYYQKLQKQINQIRVKRQALQTLYPERKK
jgi:hypothetical protein